MKILICFISAVISVSASAEIPSGVFTGISQFISQSQRLPEDYVKQIPQIIHNLLILSEKNFAGENSGACVDMTNVQYVKEFQNSNNSVINEFESNFLRIEVARCFENTTAAKVLSTLSSLEFKRKAFPTLTSITARDGNGAIAACETSSAPTIGASHYCYKNFLDQSKPEYLQLFTFNDWFEITTEFQAPVYFRESLVTTKQLATKVLLHSVTYARGPRLTTIQRLFAKSFIANSQNSVFNILAEEIR